MKRKLRDWASGFMLPVIFLALGIGVSLLCSSTLKEGIIISLLMSVAATLIELKFNINENYNKLKARLENIENTIDSVEQMESFSMKIQQQKHPYFKKCVKNKMETFFQENADLLSGTYYTDPHAADTFGIAGIMFTKERGTIKAVSSISDYWEDDFAENYLEAQSKLIAEKNIRIQRIFILDQYEYPKYTKLFADQAAVGIEVYHIFTGDPYIDPEWLTEDYLIQDEELLVEINCKSHKFESTDHKTERITVHPVEVKNKLMKFQRMLERATRYE